MKAGTVFLILTLVCIIIFSIQNSTSVNVDFLFWSSSTISLALLTIICVVLGILVGMSFYIANSMKLRKVRASLKKEIKNLNAQLDALNKGIRNNSNESHELSLDAVEEQDNGKSFFDE
ncbi:MAG: lipopolysaccharide assembly LapA domain-containing protein [Bacteroidales bacterium]